MEITRRKGALESKFFLSGNCEALVLASRSDTAQLFTLCFQTFDVTKIQSRDVYISSKIWKLQEGYEQRRYVILCENSKMDVGSKSNHVMYIFPIETMEI